MLPPLTMALLGACSDYEIKPDARGLTQTTTSGAPTCRIVSPEAGFEAVGGGTVTLVGELWDAEDAAEALGVAWISDVDGRLAIGSPDPDGLSTVDVTLSIGTHTVFLDVWDSDGNNAACAVSMGIGAAGQDTGEVVGDDTGGDTTPVEVDCSSQDNTWVWVDWTEATDGAAGTALGTLPLRSGDIAVSYAGEIQFAQTSGGTNYWRPEAPYVSGVVDRAPPDADLVALVGGHSGTNRLTFSAPAACLAMAVVSLGAPSAPAAYVFDASFAVVSSGRGYWGEGLFAETAEYTLSGEEGHGTIVFDAGVSELGWQAPLAEGWHGFTVAVTEGP